MVKIILFLSILGNFACSDDKSKEDPASEPIEQPEPEPEPDPVPEPAPDDDDTGSEKPCPFPIPLPIPFPIPFPIPCGPDGGDGDSGGGSTTPSDPQAGFLELHNTLRSSKGIAGLTWSGKLEEAAMAWADKVKSNGCHMAHSGNGYGENVAWNSGSTLTMANVFDMWASEEKDYNYNSNSCSGVCGHYTQIVWAKTKELGCAMVHCPSNQQFWTCNYYPAGNYVGQKPY